MLCEHCGRSFASRKSLSIHCQALHDCATFGCPYCCYSANFRASLLSHVKRIHGKDLTGKQVKPPYTCSLCSFSCFTKYEFGRHKMKHDGAKPHKCPICDFATAEKGTLKKHMRHHTGETPFTCKDCSKKFTSQSGLARHSRIHTGVKPYPCQTCGKAYADKKSLDTHQYTHLNIKPYMCHVCTYSCVRKDILVNHICKAHGLELHDLPAYLANKIAAKNDVSESVKTAVAAARPSVTHTVRVELAGDSPEVVCGGSAMAALDRGTTAQSLTDPEETMIVGSLTPVLMGSSRGSAVGQSYAGQSVGAGIMPSALTYGTDGAEEYGVPLYIIQK